MSAENRDKRYTRCTHVLPLTACAADGNRKDGRRVRCRECAAAYGAAYYRRRRAALGKPVRGARRVRRERVAEHVGVCAFCSSAAAEHVDHGHDTGRVRGVLCFSCNAALGQFKDRPEVVQRAISYLEGNAWKPKLAAPGVYLLPS